MSKFLVIVESPAKAKTISKFLGRKYQVKASMGHVRDLPKSQFGVDVEGGFNPKYITIRGKGEILKELRAAAKKADKIFLAPDPDREGEAIAWHLQHILDIPENEPCRIEFNEITKNAIQNAVKHPRPVDQPRVDAQQARRVLDRLVGYNLSPLLWRKVRRGLSAGRVQSVAVRLICDREDEIGDFVPEEYWSLTASLASAGGKLSARLLRRGDEKIEVHSQEEMDRVLKELDQAQFKVQSVKKREKKRNPSPPFVTSTLQQEAYRKLNFTARKTMMVAQQLYEGLDLGKEEGTVGLITYLRTDSVRVSEEAQAQAREFILGKYGSEYLPEKPNEFTTKGRAQGAHEAIRPTVADREPETLKKIITNEQYKLYKLIWQRFIASQMSQAILDTTTIDVAAGDYIFRATGAVLRFAGFMRVYIEGRDEDEKEELAILPDVQESRELELLGLDPKQHFTQPPPRFTEATLVKIMEEKGIGRPSTYAPIIETVLARGYVSREEKQFYPTELGQIVIDLLKEYFPTIIDIEFTAGMEDELDQIEDGELQWKAVVAEFYDPFRQRLAVAEEEIGAVDLADEVSDEPCELCGRMMVIKIGRFGKFLACPGFPECRNTKPLLEEIGVACPRCGGAVVARRSKKGRKFFGCAKFPGCDYVSWDRPTDKVCPQCGERLLQKTSRRKGNRLVCPGENCSYEEIIVEEENSPAPQPQEQSMENYLE